MEKLSNTSEENIKVIVRLKPNDDSKDKQFLSNVKDSNSIIVHERAAFEFDKVADENSTQEEMFECCKSLFHSFVDGYNATIFAYGQTGSGKTFTMAGDSDETGITNNPGLIPRGLSYIFDNVNERALSNGVEYLIKCSFVEIYNEQIYDLLDPQQQRLNLRFNITQEVYLEQCTERVLDNPKMAEEILRRGLLNRHMASTQMNRESSRSHAVFTIVLESRESQGDLDKIKKSSLHLVDLAGSERQRDAKTEGIRLKEAGMINKSLLALSMVIRKLVESANSNKATYIAYRDSKLTLLLKDAIGGNSKTSLVACVHNDLRYVSETLSTLQFASSVKMIKNKAKINVDIHGDNESLRKEINLLREQIENFKLPQTIQEHEFDFDLVWKKRFITAMALRSCTCMDISTLNLQVTSMNALNLRQEKHIDSLKGQLELEVNKIKSMEYKYSGNEIAYADNENDTKILIEKVLQKLSDNSQNMPNQINNDQLQIQVNYLANELEKANKLNFLSVSEQTLTHSLLKDYNTIVESGDLNDIIKRSDASNVEITELQKELSQLRFKNSILKKNINSLKTLRRDERRKLESEIASMKYNLKAVDQQREVAVNDRRKTLLSINDMRQQTFSPDRNLVGINCRRRTKKPVPLTVQEEDELNNMEEFMPLEDFIKKNDENMNQLDRIGELEAELRAKQTQIGTLEYNIKEYRQEAEELRDALFAKEGLQQNLHEMEARYNAVVMSLQESNETVKRLTKEGLLQEASKDKAIKVLSEKTFYLDEELKNMETEKNMLRDELDQITLSKIFLTNECQKWEESLNILQIENDQKEKNIVSLNSKIAEQNLALIDKSPTKTELENRTLNEQIKEYQQNEEMSIRELRILNDEIEEYKSRQQNMSLALACRNEEIDVYKERLQTLNETLSQQTVETENLQATKDELVRANEQINNDLINAQLKASEMTLEYDNKLAELEKKHADKQSKLESVLESTKARCLKLLDECEAFKLQIEEYAKELKFYKQRKPEGCRIIMQSPRTPSSPLAQSFIRETESRNSLIDDLIGSKNKTEQELKDEREKIAIINTIMGNIFLSSKLPMTESTVNNMESIQARLVSLEHDYKDMSIKMLLANTEIKNKSRAYDDLLKIIESMKTERDSLRTQLDEICEELSSCSRSNIKQRIRYFQMYKDENVRLRHTNVQQADEINNMKIWLLSKNARLYDEYQDCNKENLPQ